MHIDQNDPPKTEDSERQAGNPDLGVRPENTEHNSAPDYPENTGHNPAPEDSELQNNLNLADSAENIAAANKHQNTSIDPKSLLVVKSSTGRFLNNGRIRFAIFGGSLLLLVLGYTGYRVFSPSDELDLQNTSEASVPRSNAEASAISSPEQAQHIREIQNQQADQADKNNQTFVSGFITESNPETLNPDDTAPTTQPGAKSSEEIRMFFDAQGKQYTKEQALALFQNGQNIPGVTHGDGSISDANLGVGTTATTKKNTGNKKRDEKEQPVFQPYVIEPYTQKTATTAQNDQTSVANTALDNAAQNTSTWANDYLVLRQKKAQLFDEKAQLAFEEQVTSLTEAMKPEGQKGKSLRYENIAYAESKSTTEPTPPTEVNVASTNLKKEKVLIYVGQQSRAILKSQVNSDHGLEVIATIVSGPLKNATVMGTASITDDNMRFNFNKVLRQGRDEMQVSAYGREIGTNAMGMADDVNQHYLKRLGSLTAAGVLSGVGEAYEQTSGMAAQVTGTAVITTTTDPSAKRIAGNIVGEVGDMLSGEFKKGVNRKPTVIANSGKVFNIFFNQNVYDTPNGLPAKNKSGDK